MAILDVLKYDGPNDQLVWKWSSDDNPKRSEELRFGSQLVVNESQEAIFYRGGKILDVFGPGTHTLSAYNLPLLTNLISLAFGGDSPFKAEVFFVNKSVSQDSKWGLIPFKVMEQQFRIPVPIASRGSYSIRILDSRKFLIDLVGVTKNFDQRSLQKIFRGLITEQVKSAFGEVIRSLNLSPFELETEVAALSTIAKPPISRMMNDFGLELILFKIEAISVVDSDPRVKQVLDSYHRLMEEDMDERLRLKRRKEQLRTFTVERSFDVSQTAAESIGTSGGEGGEGSSGLLGTVLGLGMAMPIAGNLSNMVTQSMQSSVCSKCGAAKPTQAPFCGSCGQPVSPHDNSQIPHNGTVIQCNKCEAHFDESFKFCPHCGDAYNPCPHCGKDQVQGLSICFDCNQPMSTGCVSCGHVSAIGMKFCPQCGAAQIKPNE